MDGDGAPRVIDLAQEPAFALGGLEVRPATLEVAAAGRREQLEPRIMQVLVVLARRRGEVVSRDELTASCWGGRIVGDDAVNRCISRLRKLAEDFGGFVIETVPRVGFLLIEAGERPAAAPRRRWVWAAAITALALTAAATAAWMALAPRGGADMIGVLIEAPRAVGSDPATRAAADLLAGELDEQVSASGVQAIAAGSAGADYRIWSTVAVEGAGLRINLRLNDARTGAAVWTAQITGPAASARRNAAVATGGATTCLARAKAPDAGPIGPDALADYVRACVLADDPEQPSEVFALLERVAERAPEFSVGHAGLALFAAVAAKGVEDPLKTTLNQRGRTEADRALALNPREGTAYVARELLVEPRSKWAERQALLARGLSLDPQNPGLLSRQGQIMASAGRLSEAEAFGRRAVALNPFAANAMAELALTLNSHRAVGEARTLIEQAYARWPQNGQVREVRMRIEALDGEPARALEILRQTPGLAGTRDGRVLEAAIRARASGSPAEIERARAFVRGEVANGLWPPFGVEVLGALGDVDAALALAERASVTHPMYEPGYLFRASTKSMRMDPRFMRVAKAWGLTGYWRASGHWPDFCRDPALTYDCAKEAARIGG